jgi:predicted Zn finger-like uncharacterized protein
VIASCTLVASVTLTVTAVVVVYTDVRCPGEHPDRAKMQRPQMRCDRILMAVPGRPIVQTIIVPDARELSGRGRAVRCGRCKALIEVIERREAA